MSERDDYVYKAKLAERTERFDDMAKAIGKVILLDLELTAEERNLLNETHKNVIGPRRASWRTIHYIEENERKEGAEGNLKIIKEHRLEIEAELKTICQDVLYALNKYLIPNAPTAEDKVFYYKMKGDYHRYLAEFAVGKDKKDAERNSYEAYSVASELANSELPATDTTRLLLALNFSVLLFEILDEPNSACNLAKTAYADALAELDTLRDESRKNCTTILEMLKDNLNLWTSDREEGVEQEEATP